MKKDKKVADSWESWIQQAIEDEFVFLNKDSNVRVALPLNDLGTIELYFYNCPNRCNSRANKKRKPLTD
jgi:hypothetical protein